MGADINVYVGPIVRSSTEFVKTEMINSCPNTGCSNHKQWIRDNYCPECGEKIQKVEVSCKTEVDLREIIEDLGHDEDFMFQPEYGDGLYIPQMGNSGDFIDTEDGTFDLTNIDIPTKIKEFENNIVMNELFRYCLKHNITIEVSYETVVWWS